VWVPLKLQVPFSAAQFTQFEATDVGLGLATTDGDGDGAVDDNVALTAAVFNVGEVTCATTRIAEGDPISARATAQLALVLDPVKEIAFTEVQPHVVELEPENL
jgi:hypothetical protein